ncbi:soluble pyridine nucleotide transhydrogenase [Planctomycetes bacterium MalM25]|nr:soluble pyridine nucleotide transhydrogenase [Planctomycetes bacterium MalM25]
MKQVIAGLLLLLSPGLEVNASEGVVLVEAESFSDHGGWVVDQQFMDLMGSPYLLAHGLGVPSQDCQTTVELPKAGRYRVWVRTRDWVAPWNAPGAPGRFEVHVEGKSIGQFGDENAEWHWQDGGVVELPKEFGLSLRDLTGFDGRCDALLFCSDTEYQPPHGGAELAELRAELLGWDRDPEDAGEYDLVVVGGGVAGTSAAISAARLGLSVALIQDRPVLGGNGSSEVRVWPEGHTNKEPYPRVGDIVTEMIRQKGPGDGNAKGPEVYNDRRKLDLALAEPNLTLLLEHRVNAAEGLAGAIDAVIAQHTHSGRRKRIAGRWFLDSTGDGVVGALVNADFEITPTGHMGMSNLWNVGETEQNESQLRCLCEDDEALSKSFTVADTPQPFPRCPWAVDLSEKDFPGRTDYKWGARKRSSLDNLGGWFWESGFNKDPILDAEWTRDLNLRAMFGAWDTLKNVDGQHPNHRLKWAAFVAGKRESRRLMGDLVLTAEDFLEGVAYPDAAFPCTWGIDLHFPDPSYFGKEDKEAFIAKATVHMAEREKYHYKGPYWAPYRCLYSRNVSNLFMAGRDISVTHEALGPVRVMRTCGMMGEVVGMAAAICKRHDCDPRAVYTDHLDELIEMLRLGVGKDSAALPKNPPAPSEENLSPINATVPHSAATDEGYDFAARIGEAPESARFSDPDHYIWGGSLVVGDDGKYHLFYSRWPRELGHYAWVTHSEIAHAVADEPLGEMRHVGVALPARGAEHWDGLCTHNPTVHRFDGKYYLYYMGNTGDGRASKSLNWTHRNQQQIGVAVADSPEGPWERFDQPLIAPTPGFIDAVCASNPSVTRRPDGGYLMVYKAVAGKGKAPGYGPVLHVVATSDSPTGPFIKHPTPIFAKSGVKFPAEDPYVWCDGSRYWAIVKDFAGHFTKRGKSTALFVSDDGFSWRLAKHPLVATTEVRWSGGVTQPLNSLERPQLLFENGEPTVLLFACDETRQRKHAFNLRLPIYPASVD